MHNSLLNDRSCLRIKGNDTLKFLQGLLTNDLSLLETQKSLYAGLLSPQGKVLFDFIILKEKNGVILDVARSSLVDLMKHLSFYKLRSDISLEDLSELYSVIASFGEEENLNFKSDYSVPDPRLAMLGSRSLVNKGYRFSDTILEDEINYHTHRITLGVPEGGKDFTFGETYPHEALFDFLHGLSFAKGCYIGQEVVSRMEHRANIRKRIVMVIGDSFLQQGASVYAEDKEIGRMGSVSGIRGLALLRLDLINEAHKKGLRLITNGNPVKIEIPSWASFSISSNS